MVSRSHVDRRVWVPLEHDSDMSGVYLAGGIRAVRRAVEAHYNGTVERFRWRRVNDDLYEVDVWDESASGEKGVADA
jgi:hypothetical protein